MKKSVALLKHERKSKNKKIVDVINFYEFVKKMERKNAYTFDLSIPKGSFDEASFNKKIEEKIIKFNGFKKKLEDFMVLGNSQMIVYGNWILYKKIAAFGRAFLNVSPPDLDENYKKTFLQTMKQLGDNFLNEAEKKKREINEIIVQADMLPGIYADNVEKIPFTLYWGK